MDNLLRIPFLNIQYLDAVLLIFTVVFLKDLADRAFSKESKKLSTIQVLILIYLILEIWNFFRSLGVRGEDFNSTFGMFLVSLSIILLFELSETTFESNNLKFLMNFVIFASIILSIDSIATLLGLTYGFSFAVEGYGGSRVMLDPTGFKNTVSNATLLTLVISYSVKYKNFDLSKTKRYILIGGLIILSIGLVLSFHRGTLYIWMLAICYVFFEGKGKSRMKNFFSIIIIAIFLFAFFGDYLTALGYNPLTSIIKTFRFSTDIYNPSWDKGRAWAQEQAIQLWKDDIFFGKGYLNYYEYNAALPHNFFITSLVTRGLIGTAIITSIIVIAYYKSILLWKLTSNMQIKEKSIIRSLIFASWLFIIGMMTQEAFNERYCLSAQYIYWGLIYGLYNYYSKKLKNSNIDTMNDR